MVIAGLTDVKIGHGGVAMVNAERTDLKIGHSVISIQDAKLGEQRQRVGEHVPSHEEWLVHAIQFAAQDIGKVHKENCKPFPYLLGVQSVVSIPWGLLQLD